MKRLLASLAVPALLAMGAPPVAAAPAQHVSLRLLDMAPWVTPEATGPRLVMAATNDGAGPADDLTFGITVFTPSRSRNQYEESLRRDPTDAGVDFASFADVPGTIAPGDRRVLRLSRGIVDGIAQTLLRGDETAVYPT